MNTKRYFLKTISTLAFGTAMTFSTLAPLESLAEETKPREARPKILVDIHFQKVPKDMLNDSFHNNNDGGLWVSIYDNVTEFYSDNFDLQIDFKRNKKIDKTKLTKNHIAIEYTFKAKLYNTPNWDLVYELGGEKLVDELKSDIKDHIKEKAIEYKKAEIEILEKFNYNMRNDYMHKGFGSKHNHIARIFPSIVPYNPENEEELINGVSTYVCHEIGHTLGLNHTSEPITRYLFEYNYKPNNFMNLIIENQHALDFDISINPEQVKQIKQYLKRK